MKTKGINKDFDNVRFEYGTQEYFEISMKSTILSCFTYGSIERDSYDFNHYIRNSGKNLPDSVFEEVYKEQCDFLKNHCMVIHSVYTDFEGCTYNSVKYY